MERKLASIFVTSLVFATAAIDAGAATVPARFQQQSGGICQVALPSGPGQFVRTRPLGMFNEGSGNAFITCSPPYDQQFNEQPNSGGLDVYLSNINSAPANVTCTLVSGTVTAVTAVKTVTLSANGGAILSFYPSDLPPSGTGTIVAPNLSCSLSPGTGAGTIRYVYDRRVS